MTSKAYDIMVGRLQSTNAGYVQAVLNAAYVIAKQADDMAQEFLESADETRLLSFLKSISDIQQDAMTADLSTDMETIDYISYEVIPIISKTYNIEESLVSEDVALAVDYYAELYLLEALANDF